MSDLLTRLELEQLLMNTHWAQAQAAQRLHGARFTSGAADTAVVARFGDNCTVFYRDGYILRETGEGRRAILLRVILSPETGRRR